MNTFFYLKSPFRRKGVAVIAPNMNGVCEQICNGFITTLEKDNTLNGQVVYRFGHGNDNKEELGEVTNDVLSSLRYDMIFTVGAQATLMAKEWTIKNRIYTPILFCGVPNPVQRGIIASENYSGNHLTGLTATFRNYTEQVQKLLSFKNDIKKVVILYSSGVLTIQAGEIEEAYEAFIKNGVMAFKLKVDNENDIEEELSRLHLLKIDVVMILRDNKTISSIKFLVNFCNSHNILLYSSDIASVRAGAALGYSDYDQVMGCEAAYKGIKILKTRSTPASIPVTLTQWTNKLYINAETISFQGRGFSEINGYAGGHIIIVDK